MNLSERWEEIEGTNGKYLISNHGRCLRLPRLVNNSNGNKKLIKSKLVAPKIKSNGYIQYSYMIDGKASYQYAHRLVYSHFVSDIRNGMNIHHLDFNPKNNNVTNLTQCSQRKNLHLSHINKSKTSNTPCVYFENGSFVGRFYVKSKPIYCGRFESEYEAKQAVENKSVEILGKSIYNYS